jgi:endonuclease YncB( thermonuclease family)
MINNFSQDIDFAAYSINTPFLSLKGIITKARVVSVYDGDTLTLIIPFKNEFFKFNCRMMGIDTCEMKSKLQQNRETAIKARNRVLQLLGVPVADLNVKLTTQKIQSLLAENIYTCWVKCYETEKFGRTLVDVCTSNDMQRTVAQTLVNEKLAYEYKGDTKLTEEQQVELQWIDCST